MEVEPRIEKQHKTLPPGSLLSHGWMSFLFVAVAKITKGKGVEGGKKECVFLADQKIVSSWGEKKAFWGILLGDLAKLVC